MKKKQTRLNVTIIVLILLIVLVICLDVKLFRDNTRSFVESHAYVTKEDKNVTLNTGTKADTKKDDQETKATEELKETEESENAGNTEETKNTQAAESERPSSGGSSFGGVFSDLLGD